MCTCNDRFHLNALCQQQVYHQSPFFFIFLDWHTSKASLGWSYRYVQQMGQQCQTILWWRSCQTYGRVPGITWHHCAAVSNAGSWTTRQESRKLHHNAPEWSRQGNEPLFKVSWLFFAESKICSNEASKRVHQKNILFLFAAVSFQRTQHVPCPSHFDVTSPFPLIELIFLSRMLLPCKQELQLPRLIYCKGATKTFDIFCIIVAKCCALYHSRIQPVLLQIISLIYCSLRKVAAKWR